MPNVILVGERFHAERFCPRIENYAEHDTRRWLDISMRMSCFAEKRNPRGFKRLSLIGARWDKALNLLPSCPEAGAWDRHLAFKVAHEMIELMNAASVSPCKDGLLSRWQCDKLLLLGRRVARAFDYDLPFLEPWGNKILVLPHPSSRSRWWNRANLHETRDTVERFLNETGN